MKIKRPKRVEQPLSHLHSSFNLSILKRSLILLPCMNLTTKYYHPQVDVNYYRVVQNLVTEETGRGNHPFAQIKALVDEEERIEQYQVFVEIVKNIKDVVLNRVNQDFRGQIHFNGGIYRISSKYYDCQRALFDRNRHNCQIQAQSLKEEPLLKLYIEPHVLKALDASSSLKLARQTQSSTIDIKNLACHIDQMIEKIDNLSGIKTHKSNNQKNQKTQKKKGKNKTKVFSGISVIKKKQDLKIDKHQHKNYHQGYGLELIKPKSLKKKLLRNGPRWFDGPNFLTTSSLPQSPKPRFLGSSSHHNNNSHTYLSSHRSGCTSTSYNSFPVSPSTHQSLTRSLSRKPRLLRKKR